MFSGRSLGRKGGPDLLMATLSVFGAQESSMSKNVPASRPLTTLVSSMVLAHCTGLYLAFRCLGRLLSHFEVHARELEVQLPPVGSLPERADGLPEPLLCSFYDATEITRRCRNQRECSGEEFRLPYVSAGLCLD